MASVVPTAATGSRNRTGVIWFAIAGLLVLLGSFRIAAGGGGPMAIAGILALVAAVFIVRRPTLGLLISLTTFLFT